MPALQLDDIQGNVLAGFNTCFEVFVALTAPPDVDWAPVAGWVASLSDQVASVAQVKAEREAMKSPGSGLTWLCVALGARPMAAARPDVVFADRAFRRGMAERAATVLGDRGSPAEWKVGRPDSPVDILLIIGANETAPAEARADALVASAAAVGLTASFRETAARIADLEHFGFRDGISQPAVLDFDPGGTVAAGNFVYGQPLAPGGPPARVVRDPEGVARNGSLLVLRRLNQDVAAFRTFCATEAARLAASQWPGLTAEHLEALIVGRWPSGALASILVPADPGPPPAGEDFDFNDDRAGLACPVGSHIRKVNPRRGDKDVTVVPRLLRRGIPFGPRFEDDPDAERGLMFVCFQTAIDTAFELISTSWMNTTNRPASNSGHDLLVGQSRQPRSLVLNSPSGRLQLEDGGRSWVAASGGAYLFAPGKAGLAKIGGEPVRSLAGSLVRSLVRLQDALAIH
ncbi:MAG TPA: hypothetical protein VFR28_05560 [Allosphingosinicella sp.]|jgi:Dyp-type peroxidase family|nr:hypothetical protein [Allosphingosinicella sp.]